MLNINQEDLIVSKIQDWLKFSTLEATCEQFYTDKQTVPFFGDKSITLVKFDAVSRYFETRKFRLRFDKSTDLVYLFLSLGFTLDELIYNLAIQIYDAMKEYDDVTLVPYALKPINMKEESHSVESKLFTNQNGVYHLLTVDKHRWDMVIQMSVLVGLYSYEPEKGI